MIIGRLTKAWMVDSYKAPPRPMFEITITEGKDELAEMFSQDLAVELRPLSISEQVKRKPKKIMMMTPAPPEFDDPFIRRALASTRAAIRDGDAPLAYAKAQDLVRKALLSRELLADKMKANLSWLKDGAIFADPNWGQEPIKNKVLEVTWKIDSLKLPKQLDRARRKINLDEEE